jgi:anthranilate phosphoribosyltransferase
MSDLSLHTPLPDIAARTMAATVGIAPPARFDLTPYIREVGRGSRGARHLDLDSARAVFGAVFAGAVEPAALGALLMALRVKGEDLDEVDGALQALDGYLQPAPVDPGRPVVVIPSYNGARKMANLTPLLACLLADAGVQVVIHGIVDDASRISTCRILQNLGIAPLARVADVDRCLSRGDPAFLPIEAISPALARLLALRQTVGVRNIGHTLVKLINPTTHARPLQLVSFTHPEFDALQHAYLMRAGRSALVMRGTEGEVVASVKRLAQIDRIAGGQCSIARAAYAPTPSELPSMPPADDALATARWIQSVLAGERPVPATIAAQVDCILDCLDLQPAG